MNCAHLVASLDELHIVYALDLEVYLQPEAFHAVRLTKMDLGMDRGVARHIRLAGLAGDHLQGAEHTSCGACSCSFEDDR